MSRYTTELDGLHILNDNLPDGLREHLEPPPNWRADLRMAAPSKVTEGGEQALLFEMRARYQGGYPVLKALHHVPNGGYHPAKVNPKTGKWYSLEAQRLQRLGLTPGVPDVCLPLRVHDFGALYMEFKKPYEDLEPHQAEMAALLIEMGNMVVRVHRGLLAWELVVLYAGLPVSLLGGY